METKHTPGPWEFRPDVTDQGFYIETVDKTHQKTFIGDVGGGLQSKIEVTANSKLIAAAPELLEALIEAKNTIRLWHGFAEADPTEAKAWNYYQASPEMKRINAAIEKATL